MTWNREIYEKNLKNMERSPYDKNTEPMNIRKIYEYAEKKGVSVSDLSIQERESFVLKNKDIS